MKFLLPLLLLAGCTTVAPYYYTPETRQQANLVLSTENEYVGLIEPYIRVKMEHADFTDDFHTGESLFYVVQPGTYTVWVKQLRPACGNVSEAKITIESGKKNFYKIWCKNGTMWMEKTAPPLLTN